MLGVIHPSPLQELLNRSWAGAGRTARLAWPEHTRLSAAEVERFLAEQRFCAIATTGSSGAPHLVPGSFANDASGTFWLPTVAGAVRLEDLRTHPRAAVLVGQGVGASHTLVLAHGVVERFHRDDLPAAVLARAEAKLGDTSWADSWLELRPKRLLAYSGVGATEGQNRND